MQAQHAGGTNGSNLAAVNLPGTVSRNRKTRGSKSSPVFLTDARKSPLGLLMLFSVLGPVAGFLGVRRITPKLSRRLGTIRIGPRLKPAHQRPGQGKAALCTLG